MFAYGVRTKFRFRSLNLSWCEVDIDHVEVNNPTYYSQNQDLVEAVIPSRVIHTGAMR